MGFSASVKITEMNFRGGYDEFGKGFTTAFMKLEGKLLKFVEDTKVIINPKDGAEVDIEIHFDENLERDDGNYTQADKDKCYIGRINLIESNDQTQNIRINIMINLPLKMFYQLSSWKKEKIIFEAMYDCIDHPQVVARVQRVYFKIVN